MLQKPFCQFEIYGCLVFKLFFSSSGYLNHGIIGKQIFRQSQVQAFSFLNFVPNSTIVMASVSNPIPVTLETSHHVPGTLEYIKSRVPEKYHGFINVFIDKEATQLPPHWDQDIAIELEEGKTPPFGPIYSLTPTEKEALHSYISDNT